MKLQYKGLSASTGIAIGPAWLYKPVQIAVEKHKVPSSEAEWCRLENALALAKKQLQGLELKAIQMVGTANAEIFQAHAMFLDDPELLKLMREVIVNENSNAEFAVHSATEIYAQMLLGLEGEYFQARSTDVRDVGRRILYCLSGINPEDIALPEDPVVVVAEDLTPSDTVQFDRKKIIGFCIVKGGPTSHVAILARSIGVPATVNTPLKIDEIQNGQIFIVDGTSGEVTVNPEESDIEAALKKKDAGTVEWEAQLSRANEPAITKDGKRVEVVSNIGGAEDARKAVQFGAEGVGLLRTEFLYMDRDTMPSEEDQIKIYHEIFEIMGRRPVVVRTLDIGGDKTVSYLGIKRKPTHFSDGVPSV